MVIYSINLNSSNGEIALNMAGGNPWNSEIMFIEEVI